MTKYTLEMIQHMAAIQMPLPAAYYDAVEVNVLLAPEEQGEQARRVWASIWRGGKCRDLGNLQAPGPVALIDAALAQADAAGYRRGITRLRNEMREDGKVNALLNMRADRLLSEPTEEAL